VSGDNAPLLLPLFFFITISDLPSLTPALYFIWPGRFFFIFTFFKVIFYKNIFSVSQFTGMYPYRPAGAVGAYMQLNFLFYRMEAPTARQGGGRLPPPI